MLLAKNFFRKLMRFNWRLILLITIASSIGFVVLYSAALGNFEPWALKQIIRFMFLFPFMLMLAVIDIRFFLKYAYVLYGISLLLLIMIFINVFSVTAMGATRWVRIGYFNIQPSEVMKICMLLALARYFHYASMVNIYRIVHPLVPLSMVLIPSALIMEQPDLGTAIILLMLGGAIFFVAGIKIWKFVTIGALGLGIAPVAWHFMHDYQKNRILTFLNPDSDPLGAGYNILQSKIAIGSGGVFGKGFLHGTQSQLSFLPEKQTDFIFTMFTEEFGFIGGLFLILLYGAIVSYGICIAVNSNHHFGRIVAIGATILFSLHVFVNIAMVMGLIPVVGVPLPLLSYGGTIMLTMLICFGLILNVDLHSDEELPQYKTIVN